MGNRQNSRSENSKRNLITGVLYKAVSIFLPFMIRTAIIYYLGKEFVGLSSLFSSILHVLNLAELGFSSAIVYHMYRPLAIENTQEVCALLNYYKKVYHLIGTVIFIAGLSILPFLPNFVKGTWPSDINIYILYILYLVNTSISYFLFAYKSALLNAAQRIDIVNVVNMVANTCQYLLQLIILVITRNFYIYFAITIFFTVLNNLIVNHLSNSKYPEYQCIGEIPSDTIKSIRTQVGGVMIGKLSDTTRNSFDSIILSTLFGLTTVAIYNNYYYIFSSIYSILVIITNAMKASIGNSIALESKEKNYEDLNKFQFVFFWITCWCTVCLLCLYQPFMEMWTGDMLLSTFDMVLFCVYFYAISMNCIRNLYFSGSGLWWKGKYSFILESFGNLILNIVLGKIWGISGVLIATIITIVIFNFVQRSIILFKNYFEINSSIFFVTHIKYILSTIIICSICYFVCELVNLNTLGKLIFNSIICIFIPNIILLMLYGRSKLFKKSVSFAKQLMNNRAKM